VLLREWLVTNGLGGYASGTIGGLATRRYHGLLIAALPNPIGRCVMLNHLIEYARLPNGHSVRLDADERPNQDPPFARPPLSEFRVEAGLPVWEYQAEDIVLERRLLLPHRQNTVIVSWECLRGSGPVVLDLRPAVHFRSYEAPVSEQLQDGYHLVMMPGGFAIVLPGVVPPLRFALHCNGGSGSFYTGEWRTGEIVYRTEESRGYAFAGSLWSPGAFNLTLAPGQTAALIASGMPCRRSRTLVMTPSVPSDPMNMRVRS